MLSLARLSDAGAAGSYYERDDYYTRDERSPSAWHGAGAQALGLSGTVDRGAFQSALEGRLPNGVTLGTQRGGEWQHCPGWDATFSAPKSVSVMALVAGDVRLQQAHERAVATTLDRIEKDLAQTRIHRDGEIRRESTDNLTVATFRHNTSREQDPQLHTHCVILNATRSADGQWRSLETVALFRAQKEMGLVYRSALAEQCRQLGYEVVRTAGNSFELAAVPQSVIDRFSSRSEQIETALAKSGLDRSSASAAQKEVAALSTRAAKTTADRTVLTERWRTAAAELGFSADATADKATRQATRPDYHLGIERERAVAAGEAVAFGIAKLSEREAGFTEGALRVEAMAHAVGQASERDIAQAIRAAERAGDVVKAEGAAIYTTRAAVETERAMLRLEQDGRATALAPCSPAQAALATARAAAASPHPWNADQRQAAFGLLTSRDAVCAVQGVAGSAKTSTVLALYAQELRAQGHTVTAMAPTRAAAEVLSQALGSAPRTVAQHLSRVDWEARTAPSEAAKGKAWIVDEASMLAARDVRALMQSAQDHRARLVLVGDVRQLGSIEAGAAFRQLQAAGMPTVKLDEIVRQTEPGARDAVYAALRGDASKALQALESGRGAVREFANAHDRYAALAADYGALSREQRSKTLVIDPSRYGRELLTGAIRAELQARGELRGAAVTAETLDKRDLTRAEAKDAALYRRGEVVRFGKDFKAGIRGGEFYRVADIDGRAGRVTLEDAQGKRLDWQPQRFGAGVAEVFEVRGREFQLGDRVLVTRNDEARGLTNGAAGEVVAVQPERSGVVVQIGERQVPLDLSQRGDQFLRHGYVQTAHSAQGATCDRVLVHAESFRENLVNEKTFYVAISRARLGADIYTDNREQLVAAVQERAGEKITALEVVGKAGREASTERSSESLRDQSPERSAGLAIER